MPSAEGLYDRYKDALKRGHVAALKGRLDEALDAYAEASRIAPERATPHTSAGTALMRRKRPADALRYYEAALTLAPRDEAAMLGRAQALTALDRRREAAEAYDRLAEHRAGVGKLADAVDAARRGLELAEGRERRRTLERLIERLREAQPGEPGRLALERAMRVLEGPAVVAKAATAATPPKAEAEGEFDADVLAAAAALTHPTATPEAETKVVAEPEAEVEPAPPLEAEADAAVEPEPEVEAAPPVRAALDRDLPEGVGADALALRAEAALDHGSPADALERLLDLAAANRAEGRMAAAIDACYEALSLVPDHVGLHLALVQLYDDNGWDVLATEKLDLLERLVALGDDRDGTSRLAAARAGRG